MPNDVIAIPLVNNKQLPAAAAQSQAIAKAEKIKCLFLVAREFRRDMQQIEADIKRACQSKVFAERAAYEYRKGGQLVTGPSVHLMTEIARIYGSIYSGWEVVGQDMENGWTDVYAEAIDLQSLAVDYRTTRIHHEFQVTDKNTKKSSIKKLTDPRDIKDWIANLAQRQKRTCIEQIIPDDLVDHALAQIEETLKHGDDEPLVQRAQNMLKKFFDSYGVTEAQIETVLGNKIAAVTENQIARMAKIFNTLRDGAAKKEDFFGTTAAPAMVEPEAKGTEVKTEGTQAKEPDAKKPPAKRVAKAKDDPKPAETAISGESIRAQEQLLLDATSTEDTEAPPMVQPEKVAVEEVDSNENGDWNFQ